MELLIEKEITRWTINKRMQNGIIQTKIRFGIVPGGI